MAPSFNGRARANLLRELSLGELPTFVFFSNGNDLVRNGNLPFECAKWIKAIAVDYAHKMNIIVRLHPNEDGSLYRNCKNVKITKDSPSLEMILEGCDWVGSLCSTVMYDALIFKKPVWQFHANGWPVLADNWKRNLAYRISSEQQFRETLNRMLAERLYPEPNSFQFDQVFANYPQATNAVADFIQNQLESSIS